MDDRARRFRAAALRHLRGKTGPGVRYPEDLQQEAVSYAKASRQRGDSLLAISRDLGVPAVTLSRWFQRAHDPEFHRVEIVTPGHAAMGSAAGVTVTTPSGMRIEGLDLDSLITLLRQLS